MNYLLEYIILKGDKAKIRTLQYIKLNTGQNRTNSKTLEGLTTAKAIASKQICTIVVSYNVSFEMRYIFIVYTNDAVQTSYILKLFK